MRLRQAKKILRSSRNCHSDLQFNRAFKRVRKWGLSSRKFRQERMKWQASLQEIFNIKMSNPYPGRKGDTP